MSVVRQTPAVGPLTPVIGLGLGFGLAPTPAGGGRRRWDRKQGAAVPRKLIRFVLLIAAVVVGTAGVVHEQQAGAATGDSVVLVWNQQALDTIAQTRTGPTVAARALAVLHTAIYDAWAAYDPVAVGTRLGGTLRQPAAERTVDNKRRAVSFAAYAALVDLFPGPRDLYAQQMADLAATGYSTPRLRNCPITLSTLRSNPNSGV
jgi:Vanadium chloroperoxidase N-terminal domain